MCTSHFEVRDEHLNVHRELKAVLEARAIPHTDIPGRAASTQSTLNSFSARPATFGGIRQYESGMRSMFCFERGSKKGKSVIAPSV